MNVTNRIVVTVAVSVCACQGLSTGAAMADQVIPDDLIVTGSECIGFDCVNGESFGFDTLRLKENNLRIKFEDTSSIAAYPTNDWQITANDSTSGGANKFSIDDIDGGSTPFTIEAGAPSNSLYVEDYGRIGFGTATPAVELHSRDGDTPTLRLEQDGSSGWSPQTWDVAGNESNFFIRDVTNGSHLVFRVRSGAPSNTIFIDNNGDVGMNTASPEAPLHLRRTDGTAQLLIEEATSTPGTRTLLRLVNNGAARWQFTNTDAEVGWNFLNNALGNLVVSRGGSGGPEFQIRTNGRTIIGPGGFVAFDLRPKGNLFIAGTLTQGSSRMIKENFSALDGAQVLAKLEGLPVESWSYQFDDESVRHIGPTAEDFHSAFGLGADDETLAPSDVAGVSIVAIKELNTRLNVVHAENQALKAENADLRFRLEALESLVKASVVSSTHTDSR